MNGAFLSCDWGTSQFRLRWVELPAATVRAEFTSDQGVARLAAQFAPEARAEGFRTCLEQSLAALARKSGGLPTSCAIVISGMASSTIGWHELPYAKLPFALDGSSLIWKEVEGVQLGADTWPVFLLSGVKGVLEIMRGEETQLLGLAQAGIDVSDEAYVLLPGTHSKHAHLKAGQLVDFSTYMTGELFQLLSQQSVLRHSVAPLTSAMGNTEQWPEALRRAFLDGVQAVREAPLVQQLFKVRTRQVLEQADPSANAAFLSGLLTGAEAIALAERASADVPIILCGGENLIQPYTLALSALGLDSRLRTVTDTGRLAILGQAVFLRQSHSKG